MIKFFRHIRRSLINQNQMGKYFKYAIGEIALVMIGILLALQVNNWNEQLKSNEYERQLLLQLRNDLELNIKDLKTNSRLLEQTINSTGILEMHLQQKLPYHDTLEIHFSNSGIWTKFLVNAGAYKTIESKGLDLISNLELRDLIFRIYEGNLNWLKHLESIIINQVENFRTKEAFNYFSKYNAITIQEGSFKSGDSKILNYDKILGDEKFRYYLNSVNNQNKILLHESNAFLKDNQQGVQLINELLNTQEND